MFKDIDQYSDLGKAVDYVSDMGLMNGYTDGTFRPDGKIRLAEVYLILYHAFPNDDKLASYDGGNHWAAPYARYCQGELGVSEEWTQEERWDDFLSHRGLDDILNAMREKKRLCAKPSGRWYLEDITRGEVAKVLYNWAKRSSELVIEEIKTAVAENQSLVALGTMKEYRFCRYFFPTDFQYAYDILEEDDWKEELQRFTYMMRIMDCKDVVFPPLPRGTELAHYTSLNALESLTRPGARFRMSPTEYLNDPEEGKLGAQKAEKILSELGEPFKNWNKDKNEGVFVGSFVPVAEKESLPMWVHYGNQAEGCIVKLTFTDLQENIYPVIYDEKKFKSYLTDVREVLHDYLLHRKQEGPTGEDPVVRFAMAAVERASFLLKDPYYKYEHEVRILQTKAFDWVQEEGSIRDGETFPRIYSELPENITITGVTLGAKVKDPERVEATLKRRGVDGNAITRSTIKYR